MALRMLPKLILMSFCFAAAQQENQRKNIKMLFVPADVMKALHKNLTVKDLPAGFPGQGDQRWTPVRLPGDKTHSFEIRINPRTANKLHMNFQHFRIGHGHGLLLELKNVSLSTKGQTILDRLVEFYKNCGDMGKSPRLGMMHRLRRPRPSLKHSLLLPGDIPLLKRIQTALERFFPRRHDGSVDVFQHKDSSGAVHFLPFEEVRREVNNLIKRTIEKSDCVKISTNALTRALEAFRAQLNGNNNTVATNNNDISNIDNEDNDDNNDILDENTNDINNNNNTDSDNNDNEDDQNGNVLSFSRNLKSVSLRPSVKKENFTSSSAINVPSDAATTEIVSALADLRKEISHLSSDIKKKENQSSPNGSKENDGTSILGIKDENKIPVNSVIKNISSDNSESKDGIGVRHEMGFDLSEVTNRRKKMSSDENDEKASKDNNNNINDNNGNKNSSGSNENGKNPAQALKTKPTGQDVFSGKPTTGKDSLEVKNNASKITENSTPVADSGGHEQGKGKISDTQSVNQTVNLIQLVKALKDAKGLKAGKDLFEHIGHSEETTKVHKQEKSKGRRYRARNRGKHRDKEHVKQKEYRKHPSVLFHYKPKSVRLKLRYKGGEYVKVKDGEDEDEGGSEMYKGKGRFVKLVHLRRRKPRIKEIMLQDESEGEDRLVKQNNYRQRKFDDSPVDANFNSDEDSMKARLLRKLRWLRNHGHAPFIRRRKSPKLRVVVYDDDEEEKEPHHENWRDSETEEFSEKIHEDDNEAETEPTETSETSESSETSAHRSEPVYMDTENTQQYEQGEVSNSHSDSDSDSDMQYLSDSIAADEGNHLGQSDGTGDVPDLEPYLKKHYEDEEDLENDEIKMYNDQDDKLGDTMEKRINKPPKQDDTILDEKTHKIDDSDDEEQGRIRIHKLPFKIQEDSDGVDTSLLKEPPHDTLGIQQVLSPSAMSSMASQPVDMPPSTPTAGQNGMDLSPNVVMPAEQSMVIPGAAELPQGTGDAESPNMAAFSSINYRPRVTTQMNSMMPQTPFPQVSSMMPVQPGAQEAGTAMTPVMQPGQMRAFISRGEKKAPKSGVRKTLKPKRHGAKKKHSNSLKSRSRSRK